ncbi:nuclear nucleic acid-binding protein C1D [Harmonia axyridis]|uniref:nuclear nucleic acid-binding protein C1D n=1 Tax=Harmonia axyridis TaxID=115357 RepID=UPI001E277870|nr:nuclear nucleic acid-binding protein C1D [Harmonia axyridis]
MDFEALGEFGNIKQKVANLHNAIDKLEKMVETALSENMRKEYAKITTKEKTDFDLLMAMTLNMLYWLHLNAIGENPAEHDVKEQLARVKEFMNKVKEAHERQTIRPKLDLPAAKRFIKHGLNSESEESEKRPNKKIRFSY